MRTAYEPLRVAVLGLGDISAVYLEAIKASPALSLRSVGARNLKGAAAVAGRYATAAASLEEMLGDADVELIVNLTPASEHDRLNRRILSSGKHLYTEKPFTLSYTAARDLAALAAAEGLRIGSAPDTFFGAAHQAARRLVDAGAIGQPVLGAAFVGHPGIEHFHPNPIGFYRPGAEAPYDIGPYFITQWVNLLGPVRRVAGSAARGAPTRQIRRGPQAGTCFAVEIPTTFNALLTFDQASVSMTMSLDVCGHERQPMELYGTDGALLLSDPNFFGDEPRLLPGGERWQHVPLHEYPFGRPNRRGHTGSAVADYRGVGLIDLALALRRGEPHRASADLIVHVTEVMQAIVLSAQEGALITLSSTCERPSPVGTEERDADLIVAASRTASQP